jgi:hypothetical protein
MKADAITVALFTLLVSIACIGCDDCPRRLMTRVSYTGAQAGTFYSRDFSRGGAVGFSSAPVDLTPPGTQNVVTTGGCWEEVAAADDPGNRLEAWVDLDGDDEQPCRDDYKQTTCGPDPGEPQAQTEFTIKAKGTTEVVLSFSDP